MRTIRAKVYKFNELSNEGKEKAIERYRNKDNYDGNFDEIEESVKKVVELFNLKTGRNDIRTGHIDDSILELKGVRLYKYIVNNYWSELFTPTYIKSVDRELRCKQFICEVNKDYKGNPYTMLFSKIKTDNSCVLTGVCYDNDILQPVYDFLKMPDKTTTFADLISDIEGAITKTYSNEEEWINSDEYIQEQIEANEYEFTADGRMV